MDTDGIITCPGTGPGHLPHILGMLLANPGGTIHDASRYKRCEGPAPVARWLARLTARDEADMVRRLLALPLMRRQYLQCFRKRFQRKPAEFLDDLLASGFDEDAARQEMDAADVGKQRRTRRVKFVPEFLAAAEADPDATAKCMQVELNLIAKTKAYCVEELEKCTGDNKLARDILNAFGDILENDKVEMLASMEVLNRHVADHTGMSEVVASESTIDCVVVLGQVGAWAVTPELLRLQSQLHDPGRNHVIEKIRAYDRARYKALDPHDEDGLLRRLSGTPMPSETPAAA